eukprot:g888.t1
MTIDRYCAKNARNCPNDYLGPVSDDNSKDIQLITNNNVKLPKKNSEPTKPKNNGLVGNKRISASTPEILKSKDLIQNDPRSNSENKSAKTFNTQISASRVDFLTPSKEIYVSNENQSTNNNGGSNSKNKAHIGGGGEKLLTKYNLKSIVHHLGFHAFSGHYITDVRDDVDANVWYRYDDTQVSKVDKAATKMKDEKSVYLAFYVLQEH